MSIDWCVLRASLFPSDFAVATADDQERQRFHAAVAVASSNPELPSLLRAGALPGVRALYEARVRARSVPRGLFAAAALATRDGGAASLCDVSVQRSAGRIPARDELVLSSHSVFHADAVTLYRRDELTGGSREVRLCVPEAARRVLLEQRAGTRAQWQASLRAAGLHAARAEGLVQRLCEVGLLESRSSCALWNGAEGPPSQSLAAAVDEVAACEASRQPQRNAFATFARPVALPAALHEAQAVGELLLRCAPPEPPSVSPILARLLDGRWLPMPELERMAQGLVVQAAERAASLDPGDEPLLRWLQDRALDPEIELAEAPLPGRTWSGTALVGTQWTVDGRLVGPTPLSAHPGEMVARYAIPGLPERVHALDDAEQVVLAYRGLDVLDEVAAVHVPGALALEYCGHASERGRALRLEDLEVCATVAALHVRVRADQRPVTLVRPIPYNDAMPGLHPLVRLLSMASRAERPGRSLLDAAFERFPVRPRLTYRGHVVARRRAVVPRELRPGALARWLATVGLAGPVTVESSHGALPLEPEVDDDAARHDLLKRLRRGERVAVSERLAVDGVRVDGRTHAVHALVPITVAPTEATPRRSPTRPLVRAPARAEAQRGPFRTVRVHALAERMPGVLRRLRDRLDGAPFFYVFLSDALESELRLRVPIAHDPAARGLCDELDALLDRRLVRHWALEPYVREWERYGGADDIEAVEAFFVADSVGLCDGCSSIPLVDERRTHLYALTMLQTMGAAGLDGPAQIRLCHRAFEALAAELGLGTEARRTLGAQWRARRDAVVEAAAGRCDDDVVHATLLRRHGQLERWLDPDNRERLRRHLRPLLHMTGTRLCYRHNRVEEAWAFFFARTLLERWRHLPTERHAARAWLP